jgi:DNA-binding SARP family transcriptional activator
MLKLRSRRAQRGPPTVDTFPSRVLEFRILGPLDVREDDAPVQLGGPKQRALLALLLLSANEPVSVDRLVDELWGAKPPKRAAHSVEVYISQLRKALGTDGAQLIVTQRPGYRISVGAEQLDLHRFERLLQSGRRALAAGDAASAAAALREALDLWRGPPLADFALDDFAQGPIARLEEIRLAAIEDRIDTDLALGGHSEVIGELEQLIARHPLRERPRGQLMLALYRAGRQAEALEQYQQTRTVLVEELGIDPSPSLQRLERAILTHDPSLEATPDSGERPAAPPAQEATRAILLAARDLRGLDALISLSRPLAGSHVPHELIVVLTPGPDGDTLAEATTIVHARREELLEDGIATRAAAFVTPDWSTDVARLGVQQDVDLLLLDARDAASGPFPDSLRTLLDDAPCDVAMLVTEPSAPDDGAVLVPFGGSEHDWSALELGAWLSSGRGTELRLCGPAAAPESGARDAGRLLATASLVVQQLAGIVATPLLAAHGAAGVVDAAAGAGVVIVGCSPRWGSEGLGRVRAEIAESVSAPCLIVRRGIRPGGLSPPESATRFTWSLATRGDE